MDHCHELQPLSEDPIDKREVLVDLLKTAIPQSFRKESPTDSFHLPQCEKKGKDSGEALPERARNKKKRSKKERSREMSDRISSAVRELDRKKIREADATIQSWKANGGDGCKGGSESKKAGDWFEMPSSEIDADVKRDLEVLALRGAFNPKRHYKNLEGIQDSKWVQVGTVMDNPVEGAKGRLPKKLRNKRTLTQQWMADPEMGIALQKRFTNIAEEEAKIDALRAQQFPLMERRQRRHKQRR